MIVPLAVFALLDAGCREVWVTDHAAIGIEPGDTEDAVERMKDMRRPRRCFAYHGPFQDRNQHQMSGRVLLWRSQLCGLARSSVGISAFRRFSAPHNFGVTLWGECSVSPILPGGSTMFDQLFTSPVAVARHRTGPLLEERLAYLTHLANQGYARRHPADRPPVIFS